MEPTLLVLAAGMGSRYGGLKQLDRIGPSGETIIDYSIYDAIRAGFKKVVFVIRESFKDEFLSRFVNKLQHDIQVELAFQELHNLPLGVSFKVDRKKPWGTGHAIWVARELIKEPFAVINADDFYGAKSFEIMYQHLSTFGAENRGNYAMCGYWLGNTLSNHGSVSRGICELGDNMKLKKVTEHKAVERNNKGRIVSLEGDETHILDNKSIASMNLWGFTPDIFLHLHQKLTTFIINHGQEPKKEFFIPEVVDTLMKEGVADVDVFITEDKWFGVTYREDKVRAVESVNRLVRSGFYPEKLFDGMY